MYPRIVIPVVLINMLFLNAGATDNKGIAGNDFEVRKISAAGCCKSMTPLGGRIFNQSLKYDSEHQLIFPTLFEGRNKKKINFNFLSENKTKINIAIYRPDGRVISTWYFDISQGLNVFRWDCGLQQEGIYILKAKSDDGFISKTVRIGII